MPKIRTDKQNVEIPCSRCGAKYFDKLNSGKNFSSFDFPIYRIQRYNDLESEPRDVHLCKDCCDKLDRFLYIYTEGQDYYIDEEKLLNNEQGE